MDYQATQNNDLSSNKSSGNSKVWMIIAIIAILALIGSLAYGYIRINNLNKKINGLQDKNKILEDSVKIANEKLKTTSAQESDEAQVLAEAKAMCEAGVSPTTTKALVFRVGENKVTFASNKQFARINAGCTETATSEGPGALYTLKKVDDKWLVVIVGNGPDPAKEKLYAIPSGNQFQ